MNIAASTASRTTVDQIIGTRTQAERIQTAMSLGFWHLAQATTYANDVTEKRVWPLAKAEEKLAAARHYWNLARDCGASVEQLAQLGADGKVAAASVEAARGRAARKLLISRAHTLKGCNTREAARKVAEILTTKGMFTDIPSAMVALAAEVSKAIRLADAAPEHVLAVWMRLDP